MFVVCCLLFVVCGALCDGGAVSLFVMCCFLFVVCCLLLVVERVIRSLCVVRCLLFDVCCLFLFVVWLLITS